MKIRLAVWCLLAFPVNAEAASVLSIANNSCSHWTEVRVDSGTEQASIDRVKLETWILGFLSGWSWTGDPKNDPLSKTDAPSIFAWMDNYCRTKPDDSISKATVYFVGTLEK